jgi:hypothetical protein
MSFKKKLGYSDAPIIIGDSTSDKDLFRPGFSYMIEDVIYTVIKDVTQDVTAQMRKVVLADGTFEIIAVESIKKDIHSYGAKRLPDNLRYAEVTAVSDEQALPTKKKKVVKKKKVTKKKAKKE